MEIESVEIDHEDTPIGRISLHRYQATSGEQGYEILINGRFLMASHGCHSERLMAELAHRRRAPDRDLTVLVGGLGAGHTLSSVLDLPRVRRVVVAEIAAKVVEWNRRFFAGAGRAAVDDSRVEVRIADVRQILSTSTADFDLILLDIDNGPGWLAAPINAALYETSGLTACRLALADGGVLAIWSPQRNPALEAALHAVFGSYAGEDTTALARRESEPPAVIYLATRP